MSKQYIKMKYKQGDILTYNNGYKKIMGVCGEIYFMSYSSENIEGENLNKFYNGYTEYSLDRNGYKLYTPPEEVEMTVAEISEALGKSVKVVE